MQTECTNKISHWISPALFNTNLPTHDMFLGYFISFLVNWIGTAGKNKNVNVQMFLIPFTHSRYWSPEIVYCTFLHLFRISHTSTGSTLCLMSLVLTATSCSNLHVLETWDCLSFLHLFQMNGKASFWSLQLMIDDHDWLLALKEEWMCYLSVIWLSVS